MCIWMSAYRSAYPYTWRFGGCCVFVNGIIYVPQCISPVYTQRAPQVALVVKNSPTNAEDVRDVGSIPGYGRSPGERHILAWKVQWTEEPGVVHRVAGSDTMKMTWHTHTHAHSEEILPRHTVWTWSISDNSSTMSQSVDKPCYIQPFSTDGHPLGFCFSAPKQKLL